MKVKLEEQSAINNDQLQIDRRLLNMCGPKIRVDDTFTRRCQKHG